MTSGCWWERRWLCSELQFWPWVCPTLQHSPAWQSRGTAPALGWRSVQEGISEAAAHLLLAVRLLAAGTSHLSLLLFDGHQEVAMLSLACCVPADRQRPSGRAAGPPQHLQHQPRCPKPSSASVITRSSSPQACAEQLCPHHSISPSSFLWHRCPFDPTARRDTLPRHSDPRLPASHSYTATTAQLEGREL